MVDMESKCDNLSPVVGAALAAIPYSGTLFAAKAAPTATPIATPSGELPAARAIYCLVAFRKNGDNL